ncbi:MAG TPA: hypothetical protein VMT24_12460 [Aggregatilineaceae bacterium]|nr:hypothetical protein [Aggregatilineaceae bacterium]
MRVQSSSIQKLLKLVVLGLIVMLTVLGSQSAQAASPTTVGVPQVGENALEVVGRIDQTALTFNSYGYVTYISGIPDAMMFSDPNPLNHNETTAHFTFVSAANLTARSVLETIFVLNAAGSTTLYYNETPKASFKDPKSFATGTAIASGPERWQSIVNVQAPDTGITTGIGQFTVNTTSPFTLGGQDYLLGAPKQLYRFSYTGEGKRTDKVAPNSTLLVAGYATTGGGQ